MRKVTELKANECIHCRTKEEYDAIIDLLDKAGKKWKTGSKLDDMGWKSYGENVCINPIGVSFCSIGYFRAEGFTIHPASDFLQQFQWGEEVEVSNLGEEWYKMKFVGVNPIECEFHFITVNKIGEDARWKLCRKPNTERAKIEAQIAELEEKLKNL